jgi:hypothetical protein
MELVAVHQTQALHGQDATGDARLPLQWEAAKNRYRTPIVSALELGPIALKAGDVIDIRLSMQYANDNSTAKGAWTVNGQQSEHWSLWAMGASGVRINDKLTFDNSDWAMPQHDQNFDNYMHYQMVDRAAYYVMDRDRPTAFFLSRTYFVASAGYATAGQPMRIVGDGYSKMQIGIYR